MSNSTGAQRSSTAALTLLVIGVVFGDPESSVGFSIPEELYEAVSEGQAARIACTPLSLVLLELRTDDYVYIATNP